MAKKVEHKQKVLELVRAAKLQTLDGGKIKFEYDGVVISITPRDELVKVRDRAEPEQAENGDDQCLTGNTEAGQ